MKINLSPIRADKFLTLEKLGDIITLNGESFDFSPIPDGGILPKSAIESDVILSDVERINGEIVLTILVPHGPNAAQGDRFPEPLTMTEDGEASWGI